MNIQKILIYGSIAVAAFLIIRQVIIVGKEKGWFSFEND